MDDTVDNSKITIAIDIQMLRPTWCTSSSPKRCNQDPQFASSVAAGGPSDDIYLFIFWTPSLPAGGPHDDIYLFIFWVPSLPAAGPCDDNGSLLLQSFIMVILM